MGSFGKGFCSFLIICINSIPANVLGAAEIRDKCAEKEIEVNIAPNKRNEKQPKVNYVSFGEELSKGRYVIERTNVWLNTLKPFSTL